MILSDKKKEKDNFYRGKKDAIVFFLKNKKSVRTYKSKKIYLLDIYVWNSPSTGEKKMYNSWDQHK